MSDDLTERYTGKITADGWEFELSGPRAAVVATNLVGMVEDLSMDDADHMNEFINALTSTGTGYNYFYTEDW